MYKKFGKRILDVLMASFALIVLSPIFIILFIFLFFYYNSSPFFFQKRPGLHGKIFSVIKFKSMVDKNDLEGKPLPDTQRITPVGVLLRKTSLDELPQLLNVLKGDMSFIGPRPLLVRYLPYYTERERTRHDTRPGITGLAQISGRNNLDWEDRLELDAQYVENLCLLLDLKIVVRTIYKVIMGADVKVIPGGNPLDVSRLAKGSIPKEATKLEVINK